MKHIHTNAKRPIVVVFRLTCTKCDDDRIPATRSVSDLTIDTTQNHETNHLILNGQLRDDGRAQTVNQTIRTQSITAANTERNETPNT